MMSEGHSARLPANVDRPPLLQRGLMNFQLHFNFFSYTTNRLKTICREPLVLFPSGPVIKGTQSADAH